MPCPVPAPVPVTLPLQSFTCDPVALASPLSPQVLDLCILFWLLYVAS